MKKFFNDFFRIPKQGKISEKTMLTRVISTVVIVVVCLFSMCFSAYAYFTCNITSTSNTIQTASFATVVTVENANTSKAKAKDSISIIDEADGIKIEGLEAGQWYNVTITPSKTNTAKTGFVVLSADGCDLNYHTQQLGVDKNVKGEYTSKLTFKIMLTDATNLVLKSCWGTSTLYQSKNANTAQYITQNKEIKMIINGYSKPNLSGDNKEEDNNKTQQNTSSTSSSSNNTSSQKNDSTDSLVTSTPSNTAVEPTEEALVESTSTDN